jgi:hypothetical protein
MFTYIFEYRIRKQGDDRPWLDIPASRDRAKRLTETRPRPTRMF